MTDEEFSVFVEQGIAEIPERFREKIKNVAFLVADEPTRAQLTENDIPDGDTLLWLYHGIPLTERGEYYGMGGVLPDTITLFKLPILEDAGGDTARLQHIVTDTIWHEIAHYFGYDDEGIEKREDAGTNHTP